MGAVLSTQHLPRHRKSAADSGRFRLKININNLVGDEFRIYRRPEVESETKYEINALT